MVIERIALKNIKIYEDTEILLHPGVNFIKGKNGAGKSTLIECIGYALFNYSDSKNANEDFLTYGKTEGSIEIDFTGAENKKYTVARTVSVKQNKRSWQVYPRGADTPLELYYEEEKAVYLAEAMGLGKEKDIAWLFKDIIGVRQGAFKEPFDKALEERKKYFNKIFGVEDYSKAFDQLSSVSGELKHRNDLVQKDINYLTDAAKGLDEKLKEKENLMLSFSEAEKNLETLTKQLKTVAEQLSALMQIRDKKANVEKLIISSEQSIKNLASVLYQKEMQKKVSLDATQKQKFHEKGYRDYIELKEALNALDQKAVIKREIFIRAADTKNAVGKLNAKMLAEKQALEQNEQNIAKEKAELLIGKETALKNLSALNAELDEAQKKNMLLKDLEGNTVKFEKYIEKGREFVDSLNAQVMKHDRIKDTAKQLVQEKETLLLLLPFEKKLEDLKIQIEELKKSKSVLEEKFLTMQKYEAELERGACPFFKGECTAAKQQGQAGLQSQKDEITAFLRELTVKLAKNEKELSSLKIYEGTGVKIDMTAHKLSENESEMIIAQEELSKLVIKPFGWNMAQKISEYSNEYQAATGDKPPQSAAAKLFLEYTVLLGIHPNEAAQKYMLAFDAFAEWIKAVKENLHVLLLEQNTKAGEINAKTYACNNEIQNTDNRFNALTAMEKSLEASREGLKQTAMHIEQTQEEYEKLQNEMKQYDGLEKETEEKKAEAAVKEEDFKQYIQNKAESEKLNVVLQEITETSQVLNIEKALLEEHHKELKEYEKAYDANKEKTMQESVSELNRSKGELAAGLSHVQSEILRVEKEIEQKKEAQQKLEQQINRQARLTEAGEIIKNVRAAMKTAGPKIACIFRSRIQTRADSIYRSVSKEGVNLVWSDSYEVELHDMWKGLQRKRTFKQLSGGEKMTAALAVRLSLLEEFSAAKIGFFDEPTDNMDVSRKENLADILAALCAGFSQVFVISHDDTFDKMTDNVIFLSADAKGATVYN